MIPRTLGLDVNIRHAHLQTLARTKSDRVKRLAKGPVYTVPRPDSNTHAYAYESDIYEP